MVVVVEQADAADDAEVARVVARAAALAPLRGVIHGAGVLADAAVVRQDWPHFATVYGAKVFGTDALLRHLDVDQLDFLALFASGVGVGGNVGQANHAAANAYLDALAHQLRGRGVPGRQHRLGGVDRGRRRRRARHRPVPRRLLARSRAWPRWSRCWRR